MKSYKKDLRLPILVAAMISLGFMSTDIYIPSMPDMAPYFRVSEGLVELTVAINFLGAAIAGLFAGPLSDSLGRRPLLIAGISSFLVASTGCAFSIEIDQLLFCRFIQGCGVGIFNVVGIAAIQDTFTVRESAKMIAKMEIAFTVLPTFTPILGGHLQVLFGWRSNFWVILVVSLLVLAAVIVLLKESKTNTHKHHFFWLKTLSIYGPLFKNTTYLGYITLSPVLYASEICVFTLLPFYFIDSLNVSPDHFGYYAASIIAMYGVGSFITAKLIDQFGLQKTISIGLAILCTTNTLQFFLHYFQYANPIRVSILLALHQFGMAVLYAPSLAKALETFKRAKGAAAALPNLLFMASASVGAFIAGFFEGDSLITGAFMLVMTSVLSGLIFLGIRPAYTEPAENSFLS